MRRKRNLAMANAIITSENKMNVIVYYIKTLGPIVVFAIGWFLFIRISEKTARIEKILKKICDQKGIDISDIN